MAATAFVLSLASLATATPLTLKWAELTPNEYYSTGCPLNQLSCHNTTVQRDTCCFESPGVRAISSLTLLSLTPYPLQGLFMQVQLWDTNPRTGPDDVWVRAIRVHSFEVSGPNFLLHHRPFMAYGPTSMYLYSITCH